jgi:hypothetical protein
LWDIETVPNQFENNDSEKKKETEPQKNLEHPKTTYLRSPYVGLPGNQEEK